MKSATPPLLPLLRSRAQGDILAWVLLHPEVAHSLKEIAEATGTSAPTVMREVDRLVAAGLVRSTRRGNLRQVQALTQSRLYRPLAEVLALTFGPVGVLREALADVGGIEQAWIYGSWADRYAGNPGAVPGDLDVLVVGAVDRVLLDEVIRDAERVLRREINVRPVSAEVWAADEGSFKTTMLSRPRVFLVGEEVPS